MYFNLIYVDVTIRIVLFTNTGCSNTVLLISGQFEWHAFWSGYLLGSDRIFSIQNFALILPVNFSVIGANLISVM